MGEGFEQHPPLPPTPSLKGRGSSTKSAYAVAAKLSPFFTASSIVPTM